MINDFEEHGVRDSILYEFVSLLETLENVVAVIRLGGDEFRNGRIEKELKETLLFKQCTENRSGAYKPSCSPYILLLIFLRSRDHKSYCRSQAQLIQADSLIEQVLLCSGELPAHKLFDGASTTVGVIFSYTMNHHVGKMKHCFVQRRSAV